MNHEEVLIANAKAGREWKCSTSEQIVVALALGLPRELPREYATIGDAWLRLNDRQREIVRTNNPRMAAKGEEHLVRLTERLGHHPINDHGSPPGARP